MGVFEELSEASEFHSVKVNKASISISAIDNSREALERFQPVALRAIEHQGQGFTVYGTPHRTTRYSGNLIDLVVLVKESG